jgi:small conductance mechanosensitive channel
LYGWPVSIEYSLKQPFVDLWRKIVNIGPKWLVALAILLVAWLLAKLVGKLVQKAIGRTSTEGHVDILIARGASAAIIVLGVMLALTEVGLSFGHVITALGLVSVGIGFALQDILGNLFAGVLLLVQHPFTIGDQIRVGEQEGFVETVRVRDTQLLTYDGERVFVPNRTVFASPIINYSSTPSLRKDVRVGIKYAADIESARRLALETMKGIPGVLRQPEPVVLIESEVDHVVLILRFWTESDRNRGLKVNSAVVESLLERYQAEGIDFMHEPPQTDAPTPPAGPPDAGETGMMDVVD